MNSLYPACVTETYVFGVWMSVCLSFVLLIPERWSKYPHGLSVDLKPETVKRPNLVPHAKDVGSRSVAGGCMMSSVGFEYIFRTFLIFFRSLPYSVVNI